MKMKSALQWAVWMSQLVCTSWNKSQF